MLTLRQGPFSLVLNSPVKAKIRAYNLIGWGQFSTVTTSFGLISTEPRQPPSSPARGANTDDTQLHVTWSELTGDDTGNEPILFYHVLYKAISDSSWLFFSFDG